MKNLLRSVLTLAVCIGLLSAKAQVPVLSSNNAATPVIFLDFDGHTVVGTGWNYDGPIYCAPAGLSSTQMTIIFNRVAEDYRPFTVNVTTDSTKFLAAPLNRRVRVILTTTWEWYGATGGVSYPGTFNDGDDMPCFVFASLFSGGADIINRPKNIAEAASHEVGHTLGLYHQALYDNNCVRVTEYYGGQGSGEIGWAPIMGVGYYQNLTVWHNGPNPYGCTNYQSDLSIITNTDAFSTNGISFRTDDHSGSFATPTVANFVSNIFNVNGIIENNTDQDLVRFTVPANGGRFVLNAVPYNVGTGNAGSNLDLQITLYNDAQAQLNVYNPGTLLSSVIDTILNPGNYYLKTEGRGNIYAPNYASLGSYSLQGQLTPGNPLPLRVLKLNGQVNGDNHQLNWIIEADEQVTQLVLEVSTDGRNFNPVTQTSNDARAYTYRPVAASAALYRINVTFDNGRQYYSNIVTLRKTGAVQKPQLVNNIVSNGAAGITSPGTFGYQLFDLSGKTVAKGQLTNGFNTISTGNLTNGMYLIRFTGGADQWTEKLVLQ
ncbi:MAG: zinc-dependent metalloprotease [Chitinophagaceae bacterium]|nr:zinc-dependent metalloprotease [Chitinophagaceae bacterium]